MQDKNMLERVRLVQAVKKMYEYGLVKSVGGNASIRLEGGSKILVTPTCGDMEDKEGMKADDLALVSIEGKILGGLKKPSFDTPIHLAVYRHRSDVNAILHTHSPAATSFAALKMKLPVILTEAAAVLGGEILVADYVFPGTKPESIAHALGDRAAILLQNHGALTVGGTIEEALTAAIILEEAAQVCLMARTLGEPVKLPGEDIQRIRHLYQHGIMGKKRTG